MKEHSTLTLQIRLMRPEDYPAATSIYNAQNEPHHQLTEDELRRSSERGNERGYYRVLSALKDGDVIGHGMVTARVGDASLGKYWTWFFVREDHRGSGVDTAMYHEALELLAGRNPTNLWTCIREDFVRMAGYLPDCGYQEQFRSWGAHLELAGFDPAAFKPYQETLSRRGIALRTYAQLAGDAERDRKLADLQAELEEDAPHCEPIIPKRHPRPHDPATLLGSYVVAVRGDEYVGLASLTKQKRFPTVAGSGLIGVRRDQRNQGLGTALSAHTAMWAKRNGYTEVNAGGAGTNAPMLTVNRRLGFGVEPAWITFAKFL